MKMECQVTAIVCTYNSDWEKLQETLEHLIIQKNVSLEIIVTDDGSLNNYKDELTSFFESKKFNLYFLNLNKENQGTVKNIKSALENAKGEYVYLTSPGDFLYDAYVLADFYKFAKKNQSKAVFGRAVYYSIEEGNKSVKHVINRPEYPDLFSKKYKQKLQKLMIFGGVKILGAIYFREKDYFIHYINLIEKYVVYTEDSTIALFSVLQGDRVDFYDRKMIWYEYGTGISTEKSEKWLSVLREEYKAIEKLAVESVKKDSVITYVQKRSTTKSKILFCIWAIFTHFNIFLMDIFIKTRKVQMTCDYDE